MIGLQRAEALQQRDTRSDPQDFTFSHQQRSSQCSPTRDRSDYQRAQFRRMYRYGLSLLLVGALCNWIGFAQHYFAPVRYLGVGCVVAGALCICIALCRWLTIRDRCGDPSTNQVGAIFFSEMADLVFNIVNLDYWFFLFSLHRLFVGYIM